MAQNIPSGVMMVTIVFVAVFAFAAAQQPPSAKAQQIENIANLAEKMADRQRQKYCERFGKQFAARTDVWNTVLSQCIEKLVRKPIDEANQSNNIPSITPEIREKAQQIYAKCANDVTNPCVDDMWKTVKRCIRVEGMAIDLLNVGQPGGVLPKNLASMSLAISSSIFDCTDKTLKAEQA